MIYLVDTNVMFRRVLASDPLHRMIKSATDKLMLQGDDLCITGQNLVEYWALATRPVAANGLGLTPVQTMMDVQQMKAIFTFLPETSAIYPAWETLVDHYGVIGRQVFDARLVAVMQVYGISSILTLNAPHFTRFAGIKAVDPQNV